MTADVVRVPCVGAVVHDADGRLLLVLRGHAPSAGTWSLPGGRVETDERDESAVAREVLEETGLTVAVGDLVGVVERDGPAGCVYVITDYACTVVGGALVAGDDADDARWVTLADLDVLPLAPLLREALTGWRVLPRT